MSDEIRPSRTDLLSEAEFLNDILVSPHVLTFQIIEKSSSLSYQLKQPALRVIIMPISRHMLGQPVYPFSEQGYLNFG